MPNVSMSTSLCEKALCDTADLHHYAHLISVLDREDRVNILKDKTEKDLADFFTSSHKNIRQSICSTLKLPSHRWQEVHISQANSSGNSSPSDLIGEIDDKKVYVETKFGKYTDSALGLSRVSSIFTDIEAFYLDDSTRDQLIQLSIQEKHKEVSSLLRSRMKDYKEKFDSSSRTIISPHVADALNSSGAQGNSSKVENYTIMVFKHSKRKGFFIDTQLRNIDRDIIWTPQVKITSQKGVPRFNYILSSQDGKKEVKMMHNNKNTSHYDHTSGDIVSSSKKKKLIESDVRNKSDFTPIPSRFQTSIPSYNLWYKEKK